MIYFNSITGAGAALRPGARKAEKKRMFKIAEKFPLNTSQTIFRVSIEAPLIAKAAKPGQFAIFRLAQTTSTSPSTDRP